MTSEVMEKSWLFIVQEVLNHEHVLIFFMIYRALPCEKCWYLINASGCIPPREREARPSHDTHTHTPSHDTHQRITEEEFSTRASLNLSIVSTWARKNGSFTSKLRPGFTERFYNRAQLTLAREPRPAIEKHELLSHRRSMKRAYFPRAGDFRWEGEPKAGT